MKNEEMRVCLESHCVYGNPVRGDHDTHDLLQYRRYVFYRKIGGQRTGGGSFCGISGIFHYVSHCHDAWKRRLYHDCQSLWGGRKG